MWMSMTGFGRGDRHGGDVSVVAEIRSVNHRFLDIHVRCPAKFLSWEMRLRSIVRQELKRGKVDLFLNIREWGKGGTTVRVNRGLLSSFLEEARGPGGACAFDGPFVQGPGRNSRYLRVCAGRERPRGRALGARGRRGAGRPFHARRIEAGGRRAPPRLISRR